MNADFRVRFAPSIPASGGEFLHIGHAAMLVCAAEVATQKKCPLDFRIDDPHKCAGSVIDGTALLDAINLVSWLGIRIRQMYVTPEVRLNEVMSAAKGDFSLYNQLTPWQVNSGYDDIVRYKTIIVRGNEFSNTGNPNTGAVSVMAQFWGATAVEEINFPMMFMNGRKVSKSNGIAPHWTTLQKYDPAMVKKYFWEMAQRGDDYEIDIK